MTKARAMTKAQVTANRHKTYAFRAWVSPIGGLLVVYLMDEGAPLWSDRSIWLVPGTYDLEQI